MCNWRGVVGQVGQDVRSFGVIVCVSAVCNSWAADECPCVIGILGAYLT
jgi:hypothetical protein